MKLHFSWDESGGALSSSVSSSIVNKDGVSPLACLLTDDGGQLFLDTVPWLDEGVVRIRSVKSSKINFSDWSRDAWGAELTKGQVRIYSLYDENYFELINIDSFERALLAWLNFVQLKPEVGVTQEVEI
ncbi:hypothetical protein EIG75_26825 [Pseudomonas syringae]|uniref:Uncharacterized protein n=1 Tax=Pseudomonas syringae TaxID=317 RepID=A0A6B2ARQ0_PSESX|nr:MULTISPECIES: hypothetical protein [Pseudomonas]MBI6562492.1 hypothetical protein [Pseudomonas syringae]MBI6573509.1 hypothetical protein [Pseudomonas syringae]MBI6589798.1 hypothetical protein [Pseudomonas syringae]MBI6596492.1 hypothetical protein [Pseudomonas syringae]MDC6492016.1 hypothetical protein [Pseudomonas syringae]